MTPRRKTTIYGILIEEYYWAGDYVVYIDHALFRGTYEEAIQQAMRNSKDS